MALTLTTKQIAQSLAEFLRANVTETATFVWFGRAYNQAGKPVDVASVDDWIELWVDNVRRPRRPRSTIDTSNLTITVNCFAKRTTNIYRVNTIGRDVLRLLRHGCIPIRDYAANGEPQVGSLRTFAPRTKNNTRRFNNTRTDVRTLSLQFTGFAQE